ncbi:Transcriptional regulator, AbiEi antitoxin, Type IV TA system [Stackebrandtia albiflava]|uniref:Transcriptional regulator, AbiEi antitoxin, Type IV TA system n=1 Tax=Stackebrandtia albiflava TaxID=406432 RepID=A0A562UY62_9ACTN|nr:hypothetical protein [Stackebrandtia albiflava]TWJ10552.1 Transcriptional regulator, AbiEi antitoxin, Type IV TA system [Stackebrandtia albiflava]
MKQLLPFTFAQARRAGFAPDRIRGLCRSGTWRRLRRNAYLPAEAVQDGHPLLIRAGAVLPQLIGDPVLSHETAARLWGVAHLRAPTDHIQLVRSRRGQGRRDPADAIIRQAAMWPEHRSSVHGLPLTTVARTVLDIARLRGVRAGVVAMDSALQHGLCTPRDIARTVEHMAGWPFVRRARYVAGISDGRSESPLESLSRLCFLRFGVPRPRIQVDDLVSGVRVDFFWEAAGVVGEADGEEKYLRDPSEFVREKQREQRLVASGFSVVRWGWDECFRTPAALAKRVNEAITARTRYSTARMSPVW